MTSCVDLSLYIHGFAYAKFEQFLRKNATDWSIRLNEMSTYTALLFLALLRQKYNFVHFNFIAGNGDVYISYNFYNNNETTPEMPESVQEDGLETCSDERINVCMY